MSTFEIERVLDEFDSGLDRGEVPLAIYGDPEIYKLECERVFARCWNYLAHESEIPNPGDYVLRYVVDTPLIVARDANGQINVLFDSCRHRGSRVCQASRGNTAAFRCAYHGWTYRPDGKLIGVPSRECYPELDEEKWSLLKPRMATYHGLIFTCFDERTEPLADYLGDFRWYLDAHFGLAPEGMAVVGDPVRWVLNVNWKSAVENFAGDSYHTRFLHRSIPEAGLGAFRDARNEFDVHITQCSGHASSAARVAEGQVGFWGAGDDYERYYRGSSLSPEQLAFARTSKTGQATIFPNASFVHASGTDAVGGAASSYLSFALLAPKSATQTEMWRWTFVPAGYSAEQKARSHRIALASFGPAGNAEQDDSIVWNGTARAGASMFARIAAAKLNYTMSFNGATGPAPLTDFPGPGVVTNQRLEDGVQRTILRNWLDRMRAE